MIKKFIDKLLGKKPAAVSGKASLGKRVELAKAEHAIDPALLDANAVIGPPPGLPNFLFANGFTGHGLQHAAGVGRGLAEWITQGRYTTIDLGELGYERVLTNEPFLELAIIA